MFYYTEGQMCQYLNQKEECDAIEAQHTQNKGGRPSPIKTDISFGIYSASPYSIYAQ